MRRAWAGASGVEVTQINPRPGGKGDPRSYTACDVLPHPPWATARRATEFPLCETEKLFDQTVQWSEQREVVPQEVSLLAKNDLFFNGKQGAF